MKEGKRGIIVVRTDCRRRIFEERCTMICEIPRKLRGGRWVNMRVHAPTTCCRRFSEEGGSTGRCSAREEHGDDVVLSSPGAAR